MQVFNTALSWASRNERVEIAKTLVERNANLEAKNTKVAWVGGAY